jgi:CRP-like cAMP-binding protein
MINKTETINAYPRQNTQLKFPKINGALGISDVVRKPFVNNSRQQTLLETFSVKKSSSNRLLASLNANDFSRLQPYLEPVSLALGENLYQPHDRIRYIYFPESAIVSNLQMLEDGRTVEIAMTGKEGVTGLSSIFNSQPASDWTEVSVGGEALRLDAQILKQEFYCYGTLQTSLFKYLSSYIEQISQRVICNNYHLIEKRFCSWLSMLQNRHSKNKFFLTHEQIARYLGVQRPLVSNLARVLREKRIIDYRRGQITVLDYGKLKTLTCSCFQSI